MKGEAPFGGLLPDHFSKSLGIWNRRGMQEIGRWVKVFCPAVNLDGKFLAFNL
jgi:hypothetical protein